MSAALALVKGYHVTSATPGSDSPGHPSAAPQSSGVISRRERLRTATLDEITQTARQLLVRDGTTGVTLRAIAREMGMTAPALYRYFPNLEQLVATLCGALYDEMRESLERARDACPDDDIDAQLYAMCRQFRRWCVAHPAEFELMFASPLPGYTRGAPPDPTTEPFAAGSRFAFAFAVVFAQVWYRAPFEIPSDDDIAPELRGQLQAALDQIGGVELPLGAMQVFMSCWIRLYGLVALEIFGKLNFAFTDVEPMFEAELAAAARQLGVQPPAPLA